MSQRKKQEATFTFDEPIGIAPGVLITEHHPTADDSYGFRKDHAKVLAMVEPDEEWYAFAICHSEGEARSTCSTVSRRAYGPFKAGKIHRTNLNESALADNRFEAYILCAMRMDKGS